MKTARELAALTARMEAIEIGLAEIKTAIIVREPATPLAAESFEGLRKQILASVRSTNAHLAQLVEFDRELRAGSQQCDLQLLVDGWLRHAGIERVEGPPTSEWFDVHGEGAGPPVVQVPAYISSGGDAPPRLLAPGIAVRSTGDGSDRSTSDDRGSPGFVEPHAPPAPGLAEEPHP